MFLETGESTPYVRPAPDEGVPVWTLKRIYMSRSVPEQGSGATYVSAQRPLLSWSPSALSSTHIIPTFLTFTLGFVNDEVHCSHLPRSRRLGARLPEHPPVSQGAGLPGCFFSGWSVATRNYSKFRC